MYEVYVIADSNGDNPAAFLREEAQILSLPSGYSKKRNVGWVRNNSGSDLYRYPHKEPEVVFWNNENNHTALDASMPATSQTSVDVSAQIPPSGTAGLFHLISFGDESVVKNEIRVMHPDMSDYSVVVSGWTG